MFCGLLFFVLNGKLLGITVYNICLFIQKWGSIFFIACLLPLVWEARGKEMYGLAWLLGHIEPIVEDPPPPPSVVSLNNPIYVCMG